MKKGNTAFLFPHIISTVVLSIPSLTAVYTSESRLFQALPGRGAQPHVRHLTLTHYPSLSSVSANPPPHPPIGFHGKLPSFVVPEAASQHSSIPLALNHIKQR